MFKQTRLALMHYQSFMMASLAVTACCVGLIWIYGLAIFVGVFWLKLLSLGAIFYIINDRKRNEYFYYMNLGMSRLRLWTASILVDATLFALLVAVVNQIR